jgi:hypothetical protein
MKLSSKRFARLKPLSYRFGFLNEKLMVFNLSVCGCCENLCVSDSFPAYSFMDKDSLAMAGIPFAVIPERYMKKDPVSGEDVCNACLA